MGDDLYNTGSAATPTQAATSNDFGTQNFGLDSLLNLGDVIYWLNVIALAWTIFYSIILVVEFVYYRIKFPDGELVAREAKGVKAMYSAAGLWWSFLICALLYLVYFTRQEGLIKDLLGIVTILAYIIKILVADMPSIPVIGSALGKPGEAIQDFLDNFMGNVTKALGGIVDSIMGIFGS